MLLACLSRLTSYALLPEIEEREDEYPDQIDEVPVQARDLDDLVGALAVVEAGSTRLAATT